MYTLFYITFFLLSLKWYWKNILGDYRAKILPHCFGNRGFMRENVNAANDPLTAAEAARMDTGWR